jgi:hypothetical protein
MDPQQTAYHSGGAKKTITIGLLAILLVASLVFGLQNYQKAQDYKNHTDKKIAAALAAAKAAQTKAVQDAFDAANTKQFVGSATYGSVTFSYPKTWSGYVDTNSSNEPINAYFHPDVVPGLQSKTAYALRAELIDNNYDQIVQQFNSSIKEGDVTSRAYIPPKMQGIANVTPGVYLSGKVNRDDSKQAGYMVVIKVRDKTLEISTQTAEFAADFNNVILSSLKFSP